MSETVFVAGELILNSIGILLTVTAVFYASRASKEFGDSVVGTASRDIAIGAVFWFIFMALNSVNHINIAVVQDHAPYLGLLRDGAVIAGMFCFVVAIKRFSEILDG